MAGTPLILGVSGLRGIVGGSLTEDVISRFAGAFGTWISEQSDNREVVVARDGRAGGETVHDLAITALLSAGCRVCDIGVAMTPTAGVVIDQRSAAGAMVVTASHNPQQWNGLKALVRATGAPAGKPDACAPDLELANTLIARFTDGPIGQGEPDGSRCTSDRTSATVHGDIVRGACERLLGADSFWDALSLECTVAADSVNASSVRADDLFFGPSPCHLVQVAGESSGIFPHPPEPTRENLSIVGGLCDAVREHGASVGFAQDPDADRLALIDETGAYVGEEYTIVLAASALLGAMGDRAGDATICVNLSTSRMIDDVALRHGARVVRTPVGEANVVAAMKREGAVLGGEGNGGVIWPEVTYVRDSLSAMALTLIAMSRAGKTISELVADIPAYAIVKRKTAIESKSHAQPAVDAVAAAFRDRPGARVDLQDGVRVDLEDERSWVHVRASNTEPIMRVIGEASSIDRCESLLDEVERIIAS